MESEEPDHSESVPEGDGGGETVRLFVELRKRQKGAFSRAQALEHSISDKVLQRRCRARQVQRVHHGVYVDFTGPLPWETRVWAAWLAYGPDAALTGATALRRFGLEGDWDDGAIHLAVPHTRRVNRRTGVAVRRSRDLASQLHPTRRPPTVRLEVALLTTAGQEPATARKAAILLDACRQRRTTPQRLLTELESLSRLPGRGLLQQILLDACRQRRTTPQRLQTELESLSRLPGRGLLQQILLDAAEGVQSFLEQSYLRRVERAHRPPSPSGRSAS
ncbi:hypothetical protein [Kribbella sp. CA-294648]|uniref:hypothetical protein n=1 Tax=Kribbella sp. CA-294648 TaxID=3239948 RepID=UPI003D8AA019